MAHKRKTLFPKIGKESAHNPNVQPFYSWSETHRFCTALRQVSRLIDHRIHHLPGSPVIYWLRSLITVTSSYRICTCFPFHRSQTLVRLLRHLITTYSVLINDSTLCEKAQHFSDSKKQDLPNLQMSETASYYRHLFQMQTPDATAVPRQIVYPAYTQLQSVHPQTEPSC